MELGIRNLNQKINEGKKKNPHVLVLSIGIKVAFDNTQHSSIASYLDNSHCPKTYKIMSEIYSSTENLFSILAKDQSLEIRRWGFYRVPAVVQPSGT
ncbi:hypothetical protein AVEN_146209-1 [Araneus ventricosus]|uniref:Reverse transcriptase domain-containing protein n=1 Tax=Araneus ventricosus TaxID=182803 RepID=A0A4Y2CIV6_ARAVE|nr:hypothetical protein AVEN_146209-1 [Araneus ventricosus]